MLSQARLCYVPDIILSRVFPTGEANWMIACHLLLILLHGYCNCYSPHLWNEARALTQQVSRTLHSVAVLLNWVSISLLIPSYSGDVLVFSCLRAVCSLCSVVLVRSHVSIVSFSSCWASCYLFLYGGSGCPSVPEIRGSSSSTNNTLESHPSNLSVLLKKSPPPTISQKP